jgi:hypothetical protein
MFNSRGMRWIGYIAWMEEEWVQGLVEERVGGDHY